MIIVPNGGAPEKLEYFRNKSNCRLFDNGGDDSNKNLFDNFNEYVGIGDEVLITSEDQLLYLSSLNDNEYKSRILDKCIYMITDLSDDPAYLCNKGIFEKLPRLGKTSKVIHKSELNNYINNPKYVIKNFHASGSRGVHFSESVGNIKKNENYSDEYYLVQEVCTPDKYLNYTIPVIIKDYKLKHFIPILGDEGTYFMSKWKSLHLDGTHNKYLISGIEEIIDTFKIIKGIAEIEIFINKEAPNDMTLIDLNPRWSYDSSTCSSFVNMSFVNINYDHLDGVLQDTEFFIPDGFIGPKLQLCERYCVCQNFSHI